MIVQKLIQQYPIISDQMSVDRLTTILLYLEKILEQNIAGDITEFGCYIGTTSLFIRRMLNNFPINKDTKFYVYDSFDGLPDKVSQDISPIGQEFKKGELKISKKSLINEFKKANLIPPIIEKNWFSNIPDNALPQLIAFAYLDSDFYNSVSDSLKIVWPRLSINGQIIIDDYNREALPGVDKAINDFFLKSKLNFNLKTINHLALITKIN